MVRKSLYLIIIIFIFSFSYAQKATLIKVKKTEITEMKLLCDLIKEIPKECNIATYNVSYVILGNERSMSVQGNAIEATLKDTKKGGYFFIEKIESGCMSQHRQKYKIVVE